MSEIKVLDCTLRDGGYVVNTIFGDYAIKGITRKLVNANIDIIEVGYVKDCQRKEGSTTFSCFEEIIPLLSAKSFNTKYAVMIEYGTFDLNKLIPANESGIDIIRICFFKNDLSKVADFAKSMMAKGYEVFLQPMDTLGYTDFELLELVKETNIIQPKALYVVDSYGSMYGEDLERIYWLIDHNLNKDISFGLHSHNNLQMSFMLVQKFIDLSRNKRNIIVDASCCGIGRGAGNTNTELVVDYLVRKQNKNYDINEILDILDTYILKISKEHTWGYSTPYFISGVYSVHVNNVNYLLNKHNLKAKDMKIIISEIDKNSEKRYDYEALENSIVNYFSNDIDDTETLMMLKEKFMDKKILLLAPGSSIIKEHNKIKNFIDKYNPIIIGINFCIPEFNPNILFYSNILRYDYSKEKFSQIFDNIPKIITSNIKTRPKNNENIVNYNQLIRRGWKYFDNSTIMCLRLLEKMQVKNIAIAGFDGYNISDNFANNYVDNSILTNLSLEDKKCLNSELNEMLDDYYKKNTNIKLINLTKSNLDILNHLYKDYTNDNL